MKCISRSTLGVVIGVLNIVVYLFASIMCIINIVGITSIRNNNAISNSDSYDQWNSYNEDFSNNTEDSTKNMATTLFFIVLIVCLVMTLISALLVVGIAKKRHNLMVPWVVLSIIGFVISCIRCVVLIITLITTPVRFGVILYVFLIICLALGLEALIVYPIYTLYRDMRNKNNEHPGLTYPDSNVGVTYAYPVQAPYYTAVPAKA